MSRYGNYAQPDPRYFQVGNAFLGGVQQSRDNQRQNALLDMDRQQLGLQQRRQGMMEDQYLREIQGQQAAGQQAASEREALVSLLESEGLPTEWANLPKEQLVAVLERHEEQSKPVEPDYKVVGDALLQIGPDGAKPVYTAPRTPKAPGQLYQVVGPDGKPRYVTAEEAVGQQPFNKSEKPPVGADPALQVQDAENVLAAINNAKSLIGFNTTGLIGQQLGNLGGTDAYDLRAALDTVKASIGFDRLQRMREESKTGGALGQVAVRELDLLQATIASIDANQSGGQLKQNLDRVQKQYEKAMAAYQKAMQGEGGQPGTPGQTTGGNVIDFSELPD